MERRRTVRDAVRFVLYPADNPFFAVLWRQQKRAMEGLFLHQGLILGFVLAVFAAASLVMHLLQVPFHRQGIVLYELVAWSHLIAASVYATSLWRRIRHFWREDVRPQLLLTGTPTLWTALAIPVYPLFVQAFLAVLCLPFYAAAAVLSGLPLTTMLMTVALITPLAAMQLGWATWWLFWLAFQGMVRAVRFAIWSNLPFLLTHPVQIYAWSVPFWWLLAFGLPLAFVLAATEWAWSLEPRYYPAQAKVRRWANNFWWLSFALGWGIAWAYFLPADFESKVAFTLAIVRLVFSAGFSTFAQSKAETKPPTFPVLSLVRYVLTVDLTILALCAFVGCATNPPVPLPAMTGTLAFGFVLSVAHAFAYALSFAWWQKFVAAKTVPAIWWLAFGFWFLAPFTLFFPPLAHLAGIQGWLVPLCLLPSSFVAKGFGFLPFGVQIALPAWWAMAGVQLAWSGLLWVLERQKKTPTAETLKDERRKLFTATHHLWGWLIRWEDRLSERFDNPLVTLQLCWQRRFATLSGAMNLGVILFLMPLVLVAFTPFFPHPDLVNFINAIVVRLPSLAGMAAVLSAAIVVGALDQKAALWLLGQKRVMESFVLSPLSKERWRFGFWFPRFWLCLKAMLPYAVIVWLGVLLRPEGGQCVVALTVTLCLPLMALAFGVGSVSGSLLRVWESYLELFILLPVLICAVPGCIGALFATAKWQVHSLVWLGALFASALATAFNFAVLHARLDKLRIPAGYEQWLHLAEERAKRVQRWRM